MAVSCRAGSVELYGVADRADMGPGTLVFCDGIRAPESGTAGVSTTSVATVGTGADSAPPQAMTAINTMEISPSKKYAGIFIGCPPGLFYLPGAQ